MAEDPYLYPGTSVLKNIPGIRDAEGQKAFEGRATAFRILELQRHSIVGNFDRAHLQAIHKHIFQDVYEWAGKLRTVEIAKPGSPFFAFERYLVPSLDKLAAQIKAQDQLRGLTVDEFAVRAGHYLGELNAVHPFREGNGRAQQEFIRELGLEAGHTIEWQNVSRELMYAASKVSFERADPSGLAAVISIAIVSSDRERAAFIRQAIGAMREAKTTMLPSAIGEQETRVGSIVRGKIVAVDDRHVAIATGPRSFAVLERVKLTEAVTVGDHVTARIGAREIVIEQRAQRQSRERSR